MARHTEPNANNALGYELRKMLGQANVGFESTRVIAGHSGKYPDLLITAPGRSPVVIEAEYLPAAAVEAEAQERLGLLLNAGGRIEAAIALRYPAALAESADLPTEIAHARLSYCVFTVTQYSNDHRREILSAARFPQSGWLDGSVADLADLVRLVSAPQLAVDRVTGYMEDGINRAAAILDPLTGVTPALARLLGMDNVPQTRRMAGAIIANALVFHDRIARLHPAIKPPSLVCGPDVSYPKGETLHAWTEILKINYWPIFAIGKDLLQQLPADGAAAMLKELEYTVGQVNSAGIDNAHDLTGRVFQRLISDRKYLATFYTLPPSAALLARLAVAKMDGVDWSDAAAIGRLRIADFACGTGALLSAVYEQIAARYEQSGGRAAQIHPVMMEEALYGCDVMPSAIHITGSTLSGLQPEIGFGQSRLYTMPYGRQDDGSVKIGSLELLQSSAVMTLFNTSNPALRTGSAGEETAAQIIIDVPDEHYDLVIMNPPFTSNTAKERMHVGTFAPAFAAFGSSDQDQRDMAKQMSRLKAGTCYHGHAGMASAFAALAHRKLKPGGIVAFILPLTASAASSWQAFRQMMAQDYTDLTILSIAANGKDMSFSSDTGMAECLVIARKNLPSHNSDGSPDSGQPSAHFVSLRNRPQGVAQANTISQCILNLDAVRGIEDGPYGGTTLIVGNDLAGEIITAPITPGGDVWNGVRLRDYALAQTAYALSQSQLWLPQIEHSVELKTTRLDNIATLGLYDLDIIGRPPQGPFTKLPHSETATYPALWNHKAVNEKKFVCNPDSQLQVRQGLEAKAANVWATASRAHYNREFTFNSQALAVAFTEMETIGGRVWPNVTFTNRRFDYAFTVWGNSTLGLLSHWWHSSRQQSSKAGLAIRSADSLTVLDFRALSDTQLAAAERIFDEFRGLKLQPAYLADADPNRAHLDRRLVCDLLGLDAATYRAVRRLAAKWCAEPSVHGNKRRPPEAKYSE